MEGVEGVLYDRCQLGQHISVQHLLDGTIDKPGKGSAELEGPQSPQQVDASLALLVVDSRTRGPVQ